MEHNVQAVSGRIILNAPAVSIRIHDEPEMLRPALVVEGEHEFTPASLALTHEERAVMLLLLLLGPRSRWGCGRC